MWNILNVYMLSKRVVHKFFKFQLKYGLKLFRDETHADDDLGALRQVCNFYPDIVRN